MKRIEVQVLLDSSLQVVEIAGHNCLLCWWRLLILKPQSQRNTRRHRVHWVEDAGIYGLSPMKPTTRLDQLKRLAKTPEKQLRRAELASQDVTQPLG